MGIGAERVVFNHVPFVEGLDVPEVATCGIARVEYVDGLCVLTFYCPRYNSGQWENHPVLRVMMPAQFAMTAGRLLLADQPVLAARGNIQFAM